jgi:hypothetical protein
MAETVYAFIKDGIVKNILVFEDPSESFLDHVKELQESDLYVLVEDRFNHHVMVDASYDGSVFKSPKPFESWVWGEFPNGATGWMPPIAPPTDDPQANIRFVWDETTISWIAVQI